MLVGFISYAFTMNFGAPVGGVGLRLRLYTRQGLRQGVVMRVMALSLATNWIGYLLLAGMLFAAGGMTLPEGWALGNGALRLIGAAMVLRSEEHTSELQSLMRISYAVFCLKKKK